MKSSFRNDREEAERELQGLTITDFRTDELDRLPEIGAGQADSGHATASTLASNMADSKFPARQLRQWLGSSQPSFSKIYRAFLNARLGVAAVLLVAQVLTWLIAMGPQAGWLSAVSLTMVYGMLTFVAVTSERKRQQHKQMPLTYLSWWQRIFTIWLDVVVFGLLHYYMSRGGLNYMPLFALPVLMAGVLTRRRYALSVTAAVTIFLLTEAWKHSYYSAEANVVMTQAALVSSGLFVTALLAGELASRLAREEQVARGSLELARQQAQLNRLVIEEMQHGVIVMDGRGFVRAFNPAALNLLGVTTPNAPTKLSKKHDVWGELAETVEQAFVVGAWPGEGRTISLRIRPGEVRKLRVRMRFTRQRDIQHPEDLCVLFLEDLHDIQASLRQEKLAAMGRISAGIAHEIRNPLAAIAQANDSFRTALNTHPELTTFILAVPFDLPDPTYERKGKVIKSGRKKWEISGRGSARVCLAAKITHGPRSG